MIPEDAIEEVQAIMKAAGIENALMPMEDNDPEGEPDDDEGETGDMLAALASRLSL